MFIVPISSAIAPLESVAKVFDGQEAQSSESKTAGPSFLDVFTGIFNDAVETNQQKQEDILQLMLGDTDNLEQIQANIAKAEVATELLVSVKNAVVDSYNELIRMSV